SMGFRLRVICGDIRRGLPYDVLRTMKLLLPAAIFVLMVSIGMSLRLSELFANWRKYTWDAWLRLLLATFIVPAAAALILGRIFPLNLGEVGGLFLVGAT